MKKGKVDFGVAIYPPRAIREAAKNLALLIESKGVVLCSKIDATHIAHITVFQGGFPADPSNDIRSEIEESCDLNIEVKMQTGLYLSSIGNIFWNAYVSPELLGFHLEMIQRIKPLTKGCFMEQWIDRLGDPAGLSKEAREMVIKNGFAASGKLFMPHVTIGMLSDRSVWSEIKDIIVPQASFTASQIIGGPLGYYGNIEKKSIVLGR